MAYSTMRSAIPLSSISSGATFTAKLQIACTSTTYPEGTVFDCSGFTSINVPSQPITGTITITRPGITLLFGEGDFIMNAAGNVNMFDIQAPNVTIIGASRSAKDSVSTNGATRFVMNSPNTGYHVYTKPNTTTWASSDSLTIMNCDFVGVKSVYTSVGGTVNYTTTGAGGIRLAEGNVDQPNSNLNNIMISEVLVSGAKQHGITIYGGMASKLQNVRVRNAAGHGFYIAGSTTSTSLDACYASGNYLAGFCINDTTYSTLTSCASDSNGLGYWMRNANSVTLNSCGAEACEVRSDIPNNLGITIPSSAGNILINDIGSDNVNYIKGSSFLFTGGSNITGTSCYSKDPSNREGQLTYLSKYSAHIFATSGVTKVNMDNFKRQNIAPIKYKYRLDDCTNISIDDFVVSYDPLNPLETSDATAMNSPVADVLDQGSFNIFGDSHDSVSFSLRRVRTANNEENVRFDNLKASNRFSLPVFNAHPNYAENGTIYFNTALNKLFIYNNGWYDTCCTSTPEPECTFPSGLTTYDDVGANSSVKVGDYIYSTTYNFGSGSPIIKSSVSNLSDSVFLTVAPNILTLGIVNLTYSAIENALYFSGGAASASDYPYISKFSLVTNQVTHYELTNLSGLITNLLAHVVGNSVYVTRGANSSGNSIIEKRSIVDLSLQDTFTGTGIRIGGSFQSNTIVLEDFILYAPSQGYCDEFIIFDTVNETFTTASLPGGTSSEKRLNFYKTNNRLYVASQVDGLINEFDFDFNHIDTYSNQYFVNPSTLYVNVVNSKTIATFLSAPSIPATNSEWSLVAYNLTDDEYIGSSQLVVGSPYNGASFMLELNSTTFAFGSKSLRTICSPYAI